MTTLKTNENGINWEEFKTKYVAEREALKEKQRQERMEESDARVRKKNAQLERVRNEMARKQKMFDKERKAIARANAKKKKTDIISLQERVSQADKETYLNTIADFIKTYGAEKYIGELMKQEGEKFMMNYARVLEHFLPKLQKTESNIKIDEQVKLTFIPPIKVCPHCGKDLY